MNKWNDCGCDKESGKGLDTHHQYPLRKWIAEGNDPKDYPDDLLVTLCKSCHKKAEPRN